MSKGKKYNNCLIFNQFATDLFSKLVEISKNYQGSEYQNKNPSTLDKQFYAFLDEEVKYLEGVLDTFK